MKHYYIVILLSFFTLIEFSAAQDCDKVLQLGFNKLITQSSGNFDSDFKTWFLSDSFKEYVRKQDDGFNIMVPIEEIPVNFGASTKDEQYQKLKNSINAGTTNTTSSSFRNYLFQQTVNPEVVSAWLDCVGGEQTGLKGVIVDKTQNTFVLKLKFNGFGQTYTAKFSDIYVKGATYTSTLLQKDNTVSNQWISIPFTVDDPSKDVVITINTKDNAGSFNKIIKGTPTVTVSDLDLCRQGDCDACARYRDSLNLCGPQPNPIGTDDEKARIMNQWFQCARTYAMWQNVAFSCIQMHEARLIGENSLQYIEAKNRFETMYGMARYKVFMLLK